MSKLRHFLTVLLIYCLVLLMIPSCSVSPKTKAASGEENLDIKYSENQFSPTASYSYVHFHSNSSFGITANKSWDGTIEHYTTSGWKVWNGGKISSRSYGFYYNGKKYVQAILIRGKNNTTITQGKKENAWKFTGSKIQVIGGGLSALLNYGKPSSVNSDQFAYLFDGVTTIEQKDLESIGYTSSVAEPSQDLTPEDIDTMDDSLFEEEYNPSIRKRIVGDMLMGISPEVTEQNYMDAIYEIYLQDTNTDSAEIDSKLNLKLNNNNSISISNKKVIGSLKKDINTEFGNLNFKSKATTPTNYVTSDVRIESVDVTLPNGKKAIAFVSNNKYLGEVLYYQQLPDDGSDITKTESYKKALEFATSGLENFSQICDLITDEQIIYSLIEDFGIDLSKYCFELLDHGIDISKYYNIDISGYKPNNIQYKNKGFFGDIWNGIKQNVYTVSYGNWEHKQVEPLLQEEKIHLQQSTYENDILDEYYDTKNRPTGCTITAATMIVIYNEYPKLSYTYRDMEEDKVYNIGYKEIKRFFKGDKSQPKGEIRGAKRAIGFIMHTLGKECKTTYNDSKQQSGTGVGGDIGGLTGAMLGIESHREFQNGMEKIGYKTNTDVEGNFFGIKITPPAVSSIITSLERNYPVCLSVEKNAVTHDGSHSIVADGVKYKTRRRVEKIFGKTRRSTQYNIDMIHVDFGWGKDNIGWFRMNNWLNKKLFNGYCNIKVVIQLEPKNKSDGQYDYMFKFPREDYKGDSYEKPSSKSFVNLKDFHDGEDNVYIIHEKGSDFYHFPLALGHTGFPYWNLNSRYIPLTAWEFLMYNNTWHYVKDGKNYLPAKVIVDKYDIDKWLVDNDYFKVKNSRVWFKAFKSITDARNFYGDIIGIDGVPKQIEYVPIVDDKGDILGYYNGSRSESMISVRKTTPTKFIKISSPNEFCIIPSLIKKNSNSLIEYAYIPSSDDFCKDYIDSSLVPFDVPDKDEYGCAKILAQRSTEQFKIPYKTFTSEKEVMEKINSIDWIRPADSEKIYAKKDRNGMYTLYLRGENNLFTKNDLTNIPTWIYGNKEKITISGDYKYFANYKNEKVNVDKDAYDKIFLSKIIPIPRLDVLLDIPYSLPFTPDLSGRRILQTNSSVKLDARLFTNLDLEYPGYFTWTSSDRTIGTVEDGVIKTAYSKTGEFTVTVSYYPSYMYYGTDMYEIIREWGKDISIKFVVEDKKHYILCLSTPSKVIEPGKSIDWKYNLELAQYKSRVLVSPNSYNYRNIKAKVDKEGIVDVSQYYDYKTNTYGYTISSPKNGPEGEVKITFYDKDDPSICTSAIITVKKKLKK